ncbi:MAG: hypothetical protein H6525_01685 [Actinobacteria bacterium]|nr:hypothetical protein [Actinomycetota bacterium]MCB9411551.1 hypothetical protein [Actinomycetota bacterium]
MTGDDDELDDYASLHSALSELPNPPIPADVSARVLAAIAAESEARATARQSPVNADAAPADIARARNNRRWWYAAGGVAAAGLAVALAATVLPSGDSLPVGVTAEASNTTPAEMKLGVPGVPGSRQAGPGVVPVSSGTTYSPESVARQVPEVLASATVEAPTTLLQATFAETPAGIRSCLDGVGFPPDDLALIDMARFSDTPVAVLAYLTGDDDDTADVVVVGIRCNRSDPQVRHRDVANMTP